MGIFFNSEPIVMVCPKCKEAYFTDGNPQNCAKCGEALCVLTGKKCTQSKWMQMTFEEQRQYIDAVVFQMANIAETKNKIAEKMNEETKHEKFITTTNKFENFEIEAYLGTVSGTDIYVVGGMLGGGLANQEKLFGSAFKNAKKLMFDKAVQLGADAVVGMNLQCTGAGATNSMIVVVTGTAVKFKVDK